MSNLGSTLEKLKMDDEALKRRRDLELLSLLSIGAMLPAYGTQRGECKHYDKLSPQEVKAKGIKRARRKAAKLSRRQNRA